MRAYELPANFNNHAVELNVHMSFEKALEQLSPRFAFPEAPARILNHIRASHELFEMHDVSQLGFNFSTNPEALENMDAVFILDEQGLLVLELRYATGVTRLDPSATGEVVTTVKFCYHGEQRDIISAYQVQTWHQQGSLRTALVQVEEDNDELLTWLKEANKDWAEAHLPKQNEIRITVEGRPHIGKTVVMARIARMLQRELGLVAVTIEGVDDSPTAFQEKADFPDEKVREILLRTDGIRLIESYKSSAGN